jgi:hypothetical protein
MKKTMRKAVLLLLALCMAVSLVPMAASAAVSGQDAYYLARLKPNPLPKAKESYPAKLIVNSSMPFASPVTVELKGTLGINAELTDEEIVAILKQAVSAVKSYTSPQSACDDLVLVEELLEKLKFTKEDMDEIIKNWEKLLGVDIIADLLSGKLPNTDAADMVNSLIDAKNGKVAMNPKPGMPGWGTVVDGVFISFDEWEKDQQKYKDIIKLSQANERLSAYNSRVRGLIRDKLKEKGGWRLEINSQDIKDLDFEGIPGSRQLWSAYIDLNKTDSDLTTAGGTYKGRFEFVFDAELSTFDAKYDDYWVDLFNGTDNYTAAGRHMTPPSAVQAGMQALGLWKIVSYNTKDTVVKIGFEIPEVSLNLTLPAGVNRKFFEIPISGSELFMNEYTYQLDKSIEFRQDFNGGQGYQLFNHQEIVDDDITSYSEYQLVVIPYREPLETSGGDSGSYVPDMTRYISMTLVIDMLGK